MHTGIRTKTANSINKPFIDVPLMPSNDNTHNCHEQKQQSNCEYLLLDAHSII